MRTANLLLGIVLLVCCAATHRVEEHRVFNTVRIRSAEGVYSDTTQAIELTERLYRVDKAGAVTRFYFQLVGIDSVIVFPMTADKPPDWMQRQSIVVRRGDIGEREIVASRYFRVVFLKSRPDSCVLSVSYETLRR